ncbi:hypothetical protein C6341_g17144 [Phytophthora cactorum]|nr:hypothetical protein C6341_g17144 [Phytophthora cactorum]KAG4048164.1 hypothetical protein PC123_g16514 [Phytophthora cactorum]
MFTLIFKGGRSSSDEAQSKSWSGELEAVPTAATEPLDRHASANVFIPSRYQPAARTRKICEEIGDDDGDECNASWRKRQIHCVNCECLFFTALSPVSCSAGRFCTLDCKTSFEYVNYLEDVLTVHMLGDSGVSLDSSSDEDDSEGEGFDLSQL